MPPTTKGTTRQPGDAKRGELGGLPLLDRDRLITALDRAVRRKVTLISAPAGSGKTSLLHTWARQPARRRIATVQVRSEEHGAHRFWLALLDAIGQATGVATAAPLNGHTGVDTVLTRLTEAQVEITLVVDDLQELTSPEALAALAGLVSRLPATVHAVLATRRDLPLRLHQLRLAGELAELRAADLRFTEAETHQLLGLAGVALPGTAVARLHQRTEGWAAGLRLATLSLVGHPDAEQFVEEFSGTHRAVAEYLLAEILDHQPADVRHLLLRTCLLDRVNGELADLLTGRAGSERILLDLEDANAFVVSLDPERTWFRYQQLFADLLRLELRRTLPLEVPELHRVAADWFSRRGRVALWPGQAITEQVEKLSPGELRVLRYLPTNLSRPEIAAELSISLNTVSTHIRSIYTKLGVGDRSSAVRRAQELTIPGAGRAR